MSAAEAFATPANKALFARMGVFTEAEVKLKRECGDYVAVNVWDTYGIYTAEKEWLQSYRAFGIKNHSVG